MGRLHPLWITLALAVALTGCSGSDGASASSFGGGCPITIPPEGFTPPEGYPLGWDGPEPEFPSGDSTIGRGDVWHGSAGLWTVLPDDGDYQRRKSVWWSVEFPGGIVEEDPPITVTWTRLDSPDLEAHTESDGTNAYTPEWGWFMIGGIDPDQPGCWEVEASYKGATLSYVYEQG